MLYWILIYQLLVKNYFKIDDDDKQSSKINLLIIYYHHLTIWQRHWINTNEFHTWHVSKQTFTWFTRMKAKNQRLRFSLKLYTSLKRNTKKKWFSYVQTTNVHWITHKTFIVFSKTFFLKFQLLIFLLKTIISND